MNLEDMVPDMELCARIPAGKFADSALVWIHSTMRFVDGERDGIPFGDIEQCDRWFVRTRCPMKTSKIHPAPTLVEIMADIRCDNQGDVVAESHMDQWASKHRKGNYMNAQYDINITNAALRLWFKLNGIEV